MTLLSCVNSIYFKYISNTIFILAYLENQVLLQKDQNVAKIDFGNNNKSNISLRRNDSKQQAFKDEYVNRGNYNNKVSVIGSSIV